MSLIEQLYKELERLKNNLFGGNPFSNYEDSLEFHPDNIFSNGINNFQYIGKLYWIYKSYNGELRIKTTHPPSDWRDLREEEIEKLILRMKKDV